MKILLFLALAAAVSATPYTEEKSPVYTHDAINAHFATVDEDKNLVEKASELGLTELLKYATDAGLADVLAKGGPFTVFAPTDAAFDALPEDVKKKLKDPKVLMDVLLFHLFDGNFDSSMIKPELTIPSKLKGVMIRFNEYGKIVTATGSPVSNPDQMATNGIIHVIDRVMFPIPVEDIVTAVSKTPMFSTLLKAVEVAGLVKRLQVDPLTLMAPSNDAFAKIPEEDLEKLLANKTLLTEVLTYHVVGATAYSAGLTDGQSVETLEGKSFTIHISDGIVKVNDATVVFADASTSNGVIHVIDTVLMPPEMLGKK